MSIYRRCWFLLSSFGFLHGDTDGSNLLVILVFDLEEFLFV